MDKEQLRMRYECRLNVLEKDYKRTRNLANALRDDINDITFDERVSDPQERYLMVEKLKTVEGVQTNILNFIRFYRSRLKENELEPWEEHNAIRTVDTPCGPVRLVNTDEQHHCGQDADDACCEVRHFNMDGYRQVIIHEGNIPADQAGSFSLKDLLGMQVVGIGKGKCDGCPADNDGDKCVKIEAVGGIYICLAKPEQEEPKRPVISFDDDNEESPDNIMARIKEKADDFMDYLDSVVKG